MGKKIGGKNYFLYFLLLVVFIIFFFNSSTYSLFQSGRSLLFESANKLSLGLKKDNYPITANVVVNGVNRPKIKVFLLTDVNTCIVGNQCTTSDCVNIKDLRTDQVVKQFSKIGLLALPPSRLTSEQRNSAYCMNLKFNPSEIDAVRNEVFLFKDKVVEYSNNKINPEIQIIEIGGGAGIEMAQYGPSFWVPPGGVHGVISSFYSRDTDFTFVVTDIKDPDKGVYFDPSLCDGSVGSQYNYGIGYTWMPKWKDGPGCANYLTTVHGFLHQLASAVNKVNPPSSFVSYGENNYLYNGQRLSCSMSFPNGPYSYFPDADVAPLDPDFDACEQGLGGDGRWIVGYCNSLTALGYDGEECNRRWDKHLLGDHFPPNYVLIGNSCSNGRQDFDETGVDSGGSCSIYPPQRTLPSCPNPSSENPRIIGCRSSNYPNYPPEYTNGVDVKTGYSCSGSLVCYECKIGYVRNVNTDLCDPIANATVPNSNLPCHNFGETPTAIGCRIAGGPWTINAEIKNQYTCPSSIYNCYECRSGYVRDTRMDICVRSGEEQIPVIDSDNDNVPDAIDRCPNQTSQIVNRYGCPLPVYNSFSPELTTNLSDVDLTNLRNFRIGVRNIGQIDFGDKSIKLIENISNIIRPVNLDRAVSFVPRKVIVHSELLAELNKSATVTIFNVTNLTNVIIKKDGVICVDCRIISYAGGAVTFSVPHFSEYSVDEGSFCGDNFCSSQESCSSCSVDCGSCQSTGTSGTGSGGGSGGGGSRRTFIEVQNLSNKSEQKKEVVEEQPIGLKKEIAQTNETGLVGLGLLSNNKSQLSTIINTKPLLRSNILLYIAAGVVLFILFLISIKKFGRKANKYRELENYVDIMKSKGKTDFEIKNKLMGAGWNKSIIEQILKRR
ncbi:hypothetical protein HYX19_01430 [Candidatus Woesearchaeota archaeon]|nr:hypothetical protein [Candidatus Woesearchaeota archaeon]